MGLEAGGREGKEKTKKKGSGRGIRHQPWKGLEGDQTGIAALRL